VTEPTARPLDPAERYYALVDRHWPTVIVASAELSRRFTLGEIEAAWQQTASARLTEVDGGPGFEPCPPGPVEQVPAGPGVDDVTLAEFQRPFAPGDALTRCLYLELPDGRSAIFVVTHHVLTDGFGSASLVRDLCRLLAGQALPAGSLLGSRTVMAGLREGHRFSEDRRSMIDLMRTLKAEQTALGGVDPSPWHARHDGSRRLAYRTVTLSPEETTALVAGVRAHGATMNGALGAATLRVVHGLCGTDERHVHLLTTTADMRSRQEPPVTDGYDGMFAALVSAPFAVGGGREFADLSADIAARMRTGIERGEGSLFLHVAAMGLGSDDDRAADRVRRQLLDAPSTVMMSNVGPIDDTGDPEWVDYVTCMMLSTPNQAWFVAAMTYRGRLRMAISLDEAAIPLSADEVLAALVSELRFER
jgi:hypothetical protein